MHVLCSAEVTDLAHDTSVASTKYLQHISNFDDFFTLPECSKCSDDVKQKLRQALNYEMNGNFAVEHRVDLARSLTRRRSSEDST